jgi:hypothetical protein
VIEAAAVIGQGGAVIHWHLPAGRSSGALPDSRELWEVIWQRRAELLGIAHSHPGSGLPAPSFEDVTTFSAVELALGTRLAWWITSADRVVVCRWIGPNKYDYRAELIEEPSWTAALRRWSKEV